MRGIPAVLLLHHHRLLVERSAGAVCRVHAGCGIDVRYVDDRARPDVAAGFLRGAGRRHSRFEDCTATVGGRLYRSTRLVVRAEPSSSLCPVRATAPALEWEAAAMSRCRAHRVPVRRRVLVSRDPLAPDTDLHHRTIRECRVDCRTDGTSGRDEKDVGVRSCSCGVAEKKSAARMAHGDRGENSREIRNPILFGIARYWAALVQEWYYRPLEMSSNKLNGRLPRTESPARSSASISTRCLYSYDTEAGS